MKTLRPPPRIKVLEALGALADGRVEHVSGNHYRVRSSDGTRTYEVYVDEKTGVVYSTDNGTRFRGYIGYPIIAVLMLKGVLPYDEKAAEALRGIPWRRLNEHYKRYALVEQEVKKIAAQRGIPPSHLDRVVEETMEKLRRLTLKAAPTLPLA